MYLTWTFLAATAAPAYAFPALSLTIPNMPASDLNRVPLDLRLAKPRHDDDFRLLNIKENKICNDITIFK